MKVLVTSKKKLSLLVVAFWSAVVLAGSGITIDASSAPYSSRESITSINYTSGFAEVTAGMSSAVGLYRITNGLMTAPIGSPVTITWTDKSVSKGVVVDKTSDAGVAPSADKPTPPPAQGGGGGSGGTGGGGGYNHTPLPPGSCYGHCSGTVTVGPDDWEHH